jgi:hypothetical protein
MATLSPELTGLIFFSGWFFDFCAWAMIGLLSWVTVDAVIQKIALGRFLLDSSSKDSTLPRKKERSNRIALP